MMHTPVLLKEVLEILNPQEGQTYIDMTINGGGHARAIAEKIGERGRLIGIDWDHDLVERLRTKNQESGIRNIVPVCDNYANIKAVAKKQGIESADGILFDLGFSSYHTDESGRGFSFMRDEPLDMRYSQAGNTLTAEKIINHDSREAIENIIRDYGEERFAGRIASAIVVARREKHIGSTQELAELIFKSVPAFYRRGRIHPATRTFQALRIAVNHELENLGHAMEDSLTVLGRGGVMIVISFHSLEDRIAKLFFKEKSKEGIMEIITKKPMRSTREEIKNNPRARSALLRAARKII